MGRPKGKPKSKFDDLTDQFKDAVLQSSTDEIRRRISDVALLSCSIREQIKADPEVEHARELLKNLMEPYREDLKETRLQIEFCKLTLEGKGGGITASSQTPTPVRNSNLKVLPTS